MQGAITGACSGPESQCLPSTTCRLRSCLPAAEAQRSVSEVVMMKKLLPFWAIILFAPFSVSADTTETGDWSEVAGGIQGRIIISQDRPLNGMGMFAVYLEFRNTSDVLPPIEIYFDPTRTFQCQLVDANDKPVPTARLLTRVIVSLPLRLILPPDSSLRFRVSVDGSMARRNEGALIPMFCGDWLIKSGDLYDYKFKVTLVVNPPKLGTTDRAWKGTLNLPSVKVPSRTTPNNPSEADESRDF